MEEMWQGHSWKCCQYIWTIQGIINSFCSPPLCSNVGEVCWWQALCWPWVFAVCAGQAQLSLFSLWLIRCVWRFRTLLSKSYIQRAVLKEQSTVVLDGITCRSQKWKTKQKNSHHHQQKNNGMNNMALKLFLKHIFLKYKANYHFP